MVKFEWKGTIQDIDSLFKTPSINGPYVMLVKGKPGTVKSTFCLELLDKELQKHPDHHVMYITFEQTQKSLVRTMSALGFFKKYHDKEHFDVWDIGKMVDEAKKRFSVVDNILEKHKKESYKELKTLVTKSFTRDENKPIGQLILAKRAYEILLNWLDDHPGAKRLEARRFLLTNGVSDEVFDKIWSRGKEPEEPKVYVDYLKTIIDVLKDYKKNYGDKFTMVAIDSLHAIYTFMEEEEKGEKEIKFSIFKLIKELKKLDLISIIIAEEDVEEQLTRKANYLVDGVVELSLDPHTGSRFIEIVKMRETKHETARHSFELREGKDGGIVIKGKA